jgi:hypothetical protein
MSPKKGDLMDLGGIFFENPPSGNPYVVWDPGVCGGIGGFILTQGNLFLFYMNLKFFKNSISKKLSVYFFNAPKKSTKSPNPPFRQGLQLDWARYNALYTNLQKD